MNSVLLPVLSRTFLCQVSPCSNSRFSSSQSAYSDSFSINSLPFWLKEMIRPKNKFAKNKFMIKMNLNNKKVTFNWWHLFFSELLRNEKGRVKDSFHINHGVHDIVPTFSDWKKDKNAKKEWKEPYLSFALTPNTKPQKSRILPLKLKSIAATDTYYNQRNHLFWTPCTVGVNFSSSRP